MGFFSDLFSSLFGRPEPKVIVDTPEEAVKRHVSTMERDLRQLEAAVASALVEEKKLRLQFDDLGFKAAEWERRAALAVQQQRDDLARAALAKLAEIEEEAQSMLPHLDRQHAVSEGLKEKLRAAKGRVEASAREQRTTLAVYQAAQASQQLARTMSPNQEAGQQQRLTELKGKVLQIEAEAETTLELSGHGSGDARLEREFAGLARDQRVESALAQLKAGGSARTALSAPAPAEAPVLPAPKTKAG
jgi:phage shock protein A